MDNHVEDAKRSKAPYGKRTLASSTVPPRVGTGVVWMLGGGACAVLGLNVKDVGAIQGPIGPLHTDPA
jgi:hypothetical protein